MAKNKKTQARKARQAQAAAPQPLTRRQILQRAGWSAAGILAASGAGAYALTSYRTYQLEHDLTRLGEGKPAVVQVHDPQCPTCTALQRQTRAALSGFGECDLIYLVADIRQPSGQAFAARHNVPHVTLVLFDAQGRPQEVVSGMQQAADLRPLFEGHLRRHG